MKTYVYISKKRDLNLRHYEMKAKVAVVLLVFRDLSFMNSRGIIICALPYDEENKNHMHFED